MAKPLIKLYFDILSPFTYLVFHIIYTHPVFARCEITLVPALLRDILVKCGNPPPMKVKNKDAWMQAEYKRWATYFSVPTGNGLPLGFPVPTILVQQHLAALRAVDPVKLKRAAAALYKHFFVDMKPIAESKDFMHVLEQSVGQQLARDVSAKAGTVGKDLLCKSTDKAVADGAFGLPWIRATNSQGVEEGFFGVDHLGQVLAHLGIDIPREGGWKTML